MEDPIDVGMRIHTDLMKRIAQHVDTEEELVEIGRMIDCFVGSAQVRAVEAGLDRPAEEYRTYIREKLRSLGMYPDHEAN